MKLWIKSTVSLATLTAATGAVVGSMYWFNKDSKAANGKGYSSKLPLVNEYPKEAWDATGQLKSEDDIKALLDIHFYKDGDVITSNAGKYDAKNNTINGQPYEAWRQKYDSINSQPPSMVAFFGTAAFTNEYIDAVTPADFSSYVAWFIKNVPWSGDLGSLERFNIKRGIQQNGAAIILGAHENSNKERQEINFYPDAFFGSMPGYSIQSGAGQATDNLLIKLSDNKNQLLRRSEIEALLKNKNAIESSQGGRQFRIRYIKPIELIDSIDSTTGQPIKLANGKNKQEQGYEVYIDAYAGIKNAQGGYDGNLIDQVALKYPYLLQRVSGLHVDEKGNLVEGGEYPTITTTSRIPFIGALSVSSPEFKSVGINWLKYVGAHEYGHHTTLQMGQDASEDYEYAGAFSSISGLQPGSLYSRQMQNLYLLARSHNLSIDKTSVDGDATAARREFIQFLQKGVAEKVENIYGSVSANDQGVAAALKNTERRAGQTFAQIKAAAAQLGVDPFDLFISNSWDHLSGTINPSVSGEAFVYDEASGNLIKATYDVIKGLLKDKAGNAIKFDGSDVVVQEWDDHTPVKIGADGQIIPNGTHTRSTVIFKSPTEKVTSGDDNKVTAAEILDVQRQVKNLVDKMVENYSINGWDTDSTVTLGQSGVSVSGSLAGTPYSLQTFIEAKITPDKLFYGLWGADGLAATLRSGSSDIVNIKTNGADINTLLTDENSKIFRLAFGLNNNNYGGLGSNFVGVPTQASIETQAKTNTINAIAKKDLAAIYIQMNKDNIANGKVKETLDADGAAKLADVYLTVATLKSSLGAMWSLMSGTFAAKFNQTPELFEQLVDGAVTASTKAKTDVENALKVDASTLTGTLTPEQQATKDILDQFAKEQKSIVDNAHAMIGIGTRVSTAAGSYSFLPNGDFSPQINASEFGFLVDNVFASNSKQLYNPLQIWSGAVGAQVQAFMNIDSKSGAYNGLVDAAGKEIAAGGTTSLKFNNVRLLAALTRAASTFGMNADATVLNASLAGIDSLDKFLDTFNVDPLTDFEQITLDNGHVVSVLTKTALAKFFGTSSDAYSSLKALNSNWNEKTAQQILTKAIFDTKYLSIKDTTFDYSTLDAAKKHSLFSMISIAKDMASFNSKDVVLPQSFEFKGILNAGLSEDEALTQIFKAITDFKAKDTPNYGGSTLSFTELSLFLGQQRYSSPMYNPKLLGIVQVVVGPSDDVRDALQVRMEEKYDEIFSNYTFDPAESINRDWLQITYKPERERLDNLPSFVDGVSEATTGFEYFVDGSSTSVFKNGVINLATLSAVMTSIGALDKSFVGLTAIGNTSSGLVAYAVNSIDSSYFGRSTSMTNGFFKDDFLRRSVGNELYNLDGTAVHDDKIRITDFDGKTAVTDRVRATWVWAMKTHGVGTRTLSGLWRSPDRDASYMFGYVPTTAKVEGQDVQTKDAIRYVKFTDITTGTTKLLPVTVGRNNLHYYENRQGVDGGKLHTLEQDGYTSWQSDFAPIGGYRDALLASGHDYKAEFVDANGKVITDANGKSLFTMGDTKQGTDSFTNAQGQKELVNTGRQYICENGKPFGQASTFFEQVVDTTKDTVFAGKDVKEGDAVLHVNNQFNG